MALMECSHIFNIASLVCLCTWIPLVACGNFSVEYNGKVYLHHPKNYSFDLPGNKSSVAVRVNISTVNVNHSYPLIAVFKQQAFVLSFPLPLVINNRFSYNAVSRTLCPSFIALDSFDNASEQIVVELSSSMPDESRAPHYQLRLDILEKFVLQLGERMILSVTPSSPQYFLFRFPEDVDSVLVRVHSTDTLCMTASVQAAKCPVADILDTVKFSGVYQTVTTLGAITVNKVDQNITEFLIVLVLKPEDSDCGGPAAVIRHGNSSRPRVKDLTITVTPSLAGYHYFLPIYGAVGIYVTFYIAAAVIILVYRSYDKHVRYYLSTLGHLERRGVGTTSPPPALAIQSGVAAYFHLPGEEFTTCARRFPTADAGAPAVNVTAVVAPSTTLVGSVPYQRIPPPPASHSLFSSSSSTSTSDLNTTAADPSHHRGSAKRRLLPPPPFPSTSTHIALPALQRGGESSPEGKMNHRRSMSYGSTREMANVRAGFFVGDNFSASSRLDVVGGGDVEAGITNIREAVEEVDDEGETTILSLARPVAETAIRGEGQEMSENVSELREDEVVQQSHGVSGVRKERHMYLQSQRVMYVSDLARKRYSTLDRKYLLYFWYLIIISIFYGLPVVQLVMTYQRALHDTGNEDICYYNFECAHPLGVFTAFNNIISNIGYVMLGLLFLGLTFRRDLAHRRSKKLGMSYSQAYGIPQHYGLFYAMGFALTMEGLLSACYHICPSFSNFQFDTAYMYILALILMLKIYQTRHPDINASAHSAYMVMAVVILAGVTGVLYGGETFWVLFTVVFLIMSVWLTAEIYYMGQWNFDICLPRRLYNLMRSDGIHCLTPMYMERMLLLLVANCVNIGMAAFGLFTRPRDFSSFLLSIFMVNLLMYYCFYVIMKCRFRERFHCIPLLYIFLACLTWGSAIYFFIQHSTTWEVTPAQSRALNQPCIFLGFYDVHDVWHFLSSTSMFFSFMSIMTLDDDLIDTPRNKIPVF